MNWIIVEKNLINLAFGLLISGLLIYWINLTVNKIRSLKHLGTICTCLINLLLGSALSLRWINNHYFPLSNLYESLIFLTWNLTFMQLIIEKQNKSKLIGAINMPICLFTLGFADISLPTTMQKTAPLVPALRSNWLMMHVSIMIISYAALIIGSLLSILFLIISKGKNIELQGNSYGSNISKQFSLNYNNNSIIHENNGNKSIEKNYKRINLLQSIDNLSYRIISLGFPLLTIGIIAGAVWANEAWGSYWSWDPKETWALITWLIFAIYLHSRLSKAWQGKKPAILASFGFGIIWICYLGVNFLGKGLHSYGWFL
uniref:Cytochrome c biogenesis protein CcsA n=1 Tax=Spyridia filamentosa TaxID=196632 RepID=A0A1Z1MJZ4_SPYFI|nr:cytochrome c biogenesis protein ccs1 [Spyridia filamentosa]ARW66162.1 cytochrome c biogenesis protein ccs1 [Spyridia filamentosa]